MSVFSPLTAISPIDGRYHAKTLVFAPFFSEYALIKYRVQVEIEYFIALCELPLPQLSGINSADFPNFRKIYQEFALDDAQKIKDAEKITNHDVKAVEYFVKERLANLGIGREIEFVHFGLTSQDINNTAIPMMMRHATEQVLMPALRQVIEMLQEIATGWANIPMLAFTHGQPASPTRLGKELQVFIYRLEEQIKLFSQVPYKGKFGGATGNFNAHHVAYPTIDWIGFADRFLAEKLQLVRSAYTTQIENYDAIAAYCDAWKRINTILLDFSRDTWQYISMGYFKQKINPNEVGSSAMPHKVNPIDFENAEGNLGIANAILEHLAAKLPISRLQRDLTDSTVLRNIGVPLAHILIALESLQKGIAKLQLNEIAIERDLQENWAVVAEAIQTILRREGYPKPYEALKALTRTAENITPERIQNFIASLDISEKVKAELFAITPMNYTGIL